jgi:Raf kinase inhibitor-like YbhB/YbcL family protein
MRAFFSTLLSLALVSCGATNRATDEPERRDAVEEATLTKFTLTSDAFQVGQAIPVQFTCDGADQSPALSWGEPPHGTRSFALVVDDPDAPSGVFTHWAAFDIPARKRSIGAGERIGTEAVNDFGKPGYGGPCPPKGHGPHHYHFKLYALGVERLGLDANAKIAEVESEAAKHALGKGELMGTYERK